MKIEEIRLHQLAMPLKHAFETSFGRYEKRHCVLVEITVSGITGIGECPADAYPGYSYETVGTVKEIAEREIIPVILALDDLNPAAFKRSVSHIKGHPMAKAGFEMALWDLQGKIEGQSLAELLGVSKQQVAVGVSLGLEPSAAALIEKIETYVAQGYPRVKLKIKPGRDLDVVETARTAFPDLKLQVDANSAYSFEDALKLKSLEEFDLLMLEQPLAEDDLWDHSKLQKEIDIPICLDESIDTARHARQALEMAACKIINIKSGRVGGLLEGIRIHDLSYVQGIPVWCGGMLETGVGRAANLALAGLPGFTLPGDISATNRYYEQDITEEIFELNRNGTIDIPQSVGLGVNLDRDALKSYSLTTSHFSS